VCDPLTSTGTSRATGWLPNVRSALANHCTEELAPISTINSRGRTPRLPSYAAFSASRILLAASAPHNSPDVLVTRRLPGRPVPCPIASMKRDFSGAGPESREAITIVAAEAFFRSGTVGNCRRLVIVGFPTLRTGDACPVSVGNARPRTARAKMPH